MESTEPNPFYSGDFTVSSKNAKTIYIKGWSNFGVAQPGRGYIVREGPKSSFFPKLDRIPESTIVSWVSEDDEDGPVHSQTIDLKGVVPKNTEGSTEFTFGENGIWSVKFVPKTK